MKLTRHLNLHVFAATGLLLLVVASAGHGDSGTEDSGEFDQSSWGSWDRQLRTHVDTEGRVAYRNWFADDFEALETTMQQLAQADPSTWSETQQLSFWINAYNAGTVWAVSQGRSAESLLGRAKLFKFWKFKVAGKERTLDEVEHQILRKQFEEPRIHFAIVCASTSCPALRAEAYEASRLDRQLQEQAVRFINDPARNEFDHAESRIRLSKIFDWFSEDFERDGSLLQFMAPFVEDPDVRTWLAGNAPGADTGHLSYDWTLNAQAGQRP